MYLKNIFFVFIIVLDIANMAMAKINYAEWPLEVLSWDVDKAYPGLEYNYRVAVRGGEYPYNFTLSQSPSGMTIDPKSGTIKWVPQGQSASNTVAVLIVDSKGKKLTHSFKIEATNSGFFFVSKSGNNINNGSWGSPWATMAYASAHAGNTGYIYVRKGLYQETISIDNTACGRFMAYPGDSVTVQGTGTGRSSINISGASKLLFQGLTFDATDHRWLFCVEGSLVQNIIWRKNIMFNAASNDMENPAFIFFRDGSQTPIDGQVHYKSMVIQENRFYDLDNPNNHGASVTMYDVQDLLYEDNTAYNIDGRGVSDKDDGYRNTFRNNIIHDCTIGIALFNQGTQGSIEVNHNYVYNCNTGVVLGGQPGYLRDVFVHHNKIAGSIHFSSILENPESNNINIYKNAIGDGLQIPYSIYPAKNASSSLYGYPEWFENTSNTKIQVDSNLVKVQTSTGNAAGYSWGCSPVKWSVWQSKGFDINGKLCSTGSCDTSFILGNIENVQEVKDSNSTGWPIQILSWDFDKAYPGIEYNYRIAVRGGEYPYTFTLSQGPAGMKIDTKKGILRWTPVGVSAANKVSVLIVDSKGSKLVHNFEVDATNTGFYFVSKSGSDSNNGSIQSPWATMAYASEHAGNAGYIYVREGLYREAITIGNTNCGRFIAFPGDSVTVVGTGAGNSSINIGVGNKILFQGFTFDANDHRWLFSLNASLIENVIWRNNTMYNAASDGWDNPAFIIFGDGSQTPIDGQVHYKNMAIQENVFFDLDNPNNNGASAILYDVQDLLYEDNTAYNIDGGGVSDKDDGYMNTFRNNMIHDCNNGIALFNQGTQGFIEINYNQISNCNKGVVLGGQPGYLRDVFVHHNKIAGDIHFPSILENPESKNINIYKNVIGDGLKIPYSIYPTKEPSSSLYGYPEWFENTNSTKIQIDNNLVKVQTSTGNAAGYSWGCSPVKWSAWQSKGFDTNGKLCITGLCDSTFIFVEGKNLQKRKTPESVETNSLAENVSSVKKANQIYYIVGQNESVGIKLSTLAKNGETRFYNLAGVLISNGNNRSKVEQKQQSGNSKNTKKFATGVYIQKN